MTGKLRVALGQFSTVSDEQAKFAKQLGFDSIQLNTPALPGENCWEYDDLLQLRQRCEAYGLTLEAIENVPMSFMYKIMLGLDGRDEQIRNYQTIIRNMGKAGIPILGHHFMADGTWRTSYTVPLRGGASGMGFDLDKVHVEETNRQGNLVIARDPYNNVLDSIVKSPISEEEMWANYTYFIKAVVPVAEEAGVKLALHPDDPPVPRVGGISRLFWNAEHLQRAMHIADSDAWGLDLCLGTSSSMIGGVDTVYHMIDYFGSRGKIVYVHFRDVQGTVPRFNECFLGDGNLNPVEAMKALKKVGFDGFMIDDHVPWTDYDSPWGHRSHAHQSGYLQGIIAALEEN
ncbi:mannonate dehydratase [Paenibacillus eucommiae]|uniref:mannonate dehydratase n=1 Tax=Paenibacillus eucommiae TaxID=1355755 RepID=A0ABS4J1V7_9BACL|nr:mannonate dehydratase [Paenibacillus eucommiae]MBP1993116.1 mannonate dehydratase [Paenibacillus eucommiae]